jgi:hypothetical protein
MTRERTRRMPLKVAMVLRPPQGSAVRGRARNISVSGAYVETGGRLPIGTVCTVTLTLGSGHQTQDVQCECTVVRADESGMGVAFRGTDPVFTCALAREMLWCGEADTPRTRRG